MSRPAKPFWDYVDKSGSCWEWTGSKCSKGYGNAWINGSYIGAHRASWEMTNGSIDKGFHVLHKCDNPACVNPDHLFSGTNADNVADKLKKGRQQSKLNADQVKVIKRNIGSVSQAKLAEWFGVDQSLISRIKSGQLWSRVEV